MSENFLNQYSNFVDSVTSDPSKNRDAFVARIDELYEAGLDVARVHTGADGLLAEGGEFMEIVKKMTYQGKPYNEENRYHMKRELGDIIFYWINACIAIGYNPYDVIEENIRKLEARYPNGFEIAKSEVRKAGDL